MEKLESKCYPHPHCLLHWQRWYWHSHLSPTMSIPAPCLLALRVPHLGLALACHWLCHSLARDPAVLSVLPSTGPSQSLSSLQWDVPPSLIPLLPATTDLQLGTESLQGFLSCCSFSSSFSSFLFWGTCNDNLSTDNEATQIGSLKFKKKRYNLSTILWVDHLSWTSLR